VKLIYGENNERAPEGARYRNPGFYSGPEADTSEVYLDGAYPQIEAEYLAAGVPVFQVSQGVEAAQPAPAPAPAKSGRKAKAPVDPDVPLEEAGGLTLREINADRENDHKPVFARGEPVVLDEE